MSLVVAASNPDLSSPQLGWGEPHAFAVPDSWLKWLTDKGSLTQALKSKSANQFSVEVVAEKWITVASLELRKAFGPLAPSHRFWSRQVILLGKGQPWVMAHTIIPEHSFFSPLQEVVRLNTKPLGEYLFSHPELRRGTLEISPWLDGAWGRRSLFHLYDKPIMVAEFFLPGFLTDAG